METLNTHILGHINQHRSRSASAGQQEGLSHNPADVGGVPHHPGVLNNWQGDAKDVGFLEGISANGGAAHLASDHHHGHRIHLGRGDPRNQIGGSGTGGAKTNPHLAGGAGIGVGGVGAPLFVAHQQVF